MALVQVVGVTHGDHKGFLSRTSIRWFGREEASKYVLLDGGWLVVPWNGSDSC